MTSLPTLAVTGATGALGGLVARHLAADGRDQRLLVRTPGRAPALPGAVVMPCSYSDRPAALEALSGVRTLFMVSGSESPDRVDQHATFVDAAAEAGVRHLVYTSFYGAAPDCTFTLGRDHFATEQHILGTGVDHTFLRDNFYLEFLASLAGPDDVIRAPAGDGRVAGVSRADIARVAAAVLADPGAHRDVTYHLTGDESLGFDEIAARIAEHTGRAVTYHRETVPEAYQSRRRWQAPDWMYDAWVTTYTAIAAGEVAQVTDDVARLTGRRPLSLRDVLMRADPI